MSTTDPGTAPGDTTAGIGPSHHGDGLPRAMRILPVERAMEWIRARTVQSGTPRPHCHKR